MSKSQTFISDKKELADKDKEKVEKEEKKSKIKK